MPPTIKEIREHFISKMPPGAPPNARTAMELAFMSGAARLFHLVTKEMTELSDDAANDYLTAINAELDEYTRTAIGRVADLHDPHRN